MSSLKREFFHVWSIVGCRCRRFNPNSCRPLGNPSVGGLRCDRLEIERPELGDDTRRWGPPFVTTKAKQGGSTDGTAQHQSAYFLAANRGKRSVTLDIQDHEQRTRLIELIAQADILVENYKVGNLAKYGLDYQSLVKVNPRLIYCSITGFGQTGPNAEKPGYDAMIQAMGGLMSITGEAEQSGGQPQKVGVAVTDIMTGMYAVSAILAALHHRHQSGVGQHIDLSLFDTQVACWPIKRAVT